MCILDSSCACSQIARIPTLSRHVSNVMDPGSCKCWYHRGCAGLTESQFENLVNDETIKWMCSSCIPLQTEGFDITLPPPEVSRASIDNAVWGVLRGKEIADTVNVVYSKVTKWRKNLFKVPSGAEGEDFISEVTKTINKFISGSHFESIAMTMVMIIFPLLLQKPSRNSKCKEHKEHLSRRLEMWRTGQLHKLLKECSTIQERMNSTKHTPEHHEKVFVRLMLQGKISAALKWNGSQRSGLLDATPDVIDTLISKHPKPAAALNGSVLKGPIQEVEDIIFDSIDGDLIHKVAKKISGAAGPSG